MRRTGKASTIRCGSPPVRRATRCKSGARWRRPRPDEHFFGVADGAKEGDAMNAAAKLHDLGQSLWLDNITRELLNSGTLKRYIDELSVTGLTSNPTIFDHAIKNSATYDPAIREKISSGKSGEALFFDLALQDLTRAAALFRPVHEQTEGVDG